MEFINVFLYESTHVLQIFEPLFLAAIGRY